jgi:hypothetical protein
MTGEYFYGSISMFSLLAVYAACSSLPARVFTIRDKEMRRRQMIERLAASEIRNERWALS